MSFTQASSSHGRARRMTLFCGSVLAASCFAAAVGAVVPLTHPELSAFVALSSSIDVSANDGNWVGAAQRRDKLAQQWAAERPALLHGPKVSAQTQSIDASLKWLQAAIDARALANVNRATQTINKALHEIQEMPARRS